MIVHSKLINSDSIEMLQFDLSKWASIPLKSGTVKQRESNKFRNVILGHIEVQSDCKCCWCSTIKWFALFPIESSVRFSLQFEAIRQPCDAGLFWIQPWADQCWHTIKPRRIQCRLLLTTEFKFVLLTAESNNGEKTRPKMMANRFFSPSQSCFQFI